MRRTPIEKQRLIAELRRTTNLTLKQIALRVGVGYGTVQHALETMAPELITKRGPEGSEPPHGGGQRHPTTNSCRRRGRGKDAPPVHEQVALPGSAIRPLTQFELMTGRSERRAGCA